MNFFAFNVHFGDSRFLYTDFFIPFPFPVRVAVGSLGTFSLSDTKVV